MTHETTTTGPGTCIPLASLPNLRDIGGYTTSSGATVRTGVLYRSVALDTLTDADAAELQKRGIRTVFDLRTRAERDAAPDRLPEGATGVVCDVLAGSMNAAPAQMLEVVRNPARAADALGHGQAVELFHDAYRHIVSSTSALEAYRRFFTDLAAEPTRPALFHCTTGKDRTGWAAAAALLLLGVDEEDVFADYLLTNRDLLPAFQGLFEQFAAAGGDPEILKPVLGVDPSYLHAALDEMRRHFGSIHGYFSDGLGLDAQAQGELRAALTRSEPHP